MAKDSALAQGGKAEEDPQRLRTGIPRLDYILKGGFLRGGIYAAYGPPGSGKTIFANQICFNQIKDNEVKCVYLTLLTESHQKMLRHLSQLQFYDQGAVGRLLFYISGYHRLREDGPRGLLELCRGLVKEHQPKLFIIDGVESVEGFAKTQQEHKEFLQELQSFTAMAETTTLLLSTSGSEERRRPENTLVDGMVELSDRLEGPRAVRELTVHKFRGSDYLRGRHEMEITSVGLQIHPRTEIQFDKPPGEATEKRMRMRFGIKKLDQMLGGGIPSGSTTALVGAPGAGKTSFGLQFLSEGAKEGQKGVYFGFYEPPPRLIEKAEALGIDLAKYVKKGAVEVIWQPPLEHYMDSLAEQLLEKVRKERSPRTRLFLDGVEGFRAAAVYGDRMPRFLSAFCNQLRAFDVTTLVAEELPLFAQELSLPNPELANVVESVILLRYVEIRSQLFRLLSIMKMRESRYDTAIREFRIGDRGIEMAGSFSSAEAILSGAPRVGKGPLR